MLTWTAVVYTLTALVPFVVVADSVASAKRIALAEASSQGLDVLGCDEVFRGDATYLFCQ